MEHVRFTFKIPIYNGKLKFIITNDIPRAVKTLPKAMRVMNGENCHGLSLFMHPLYVIIVDCDSYDTVSHEIGHVARALMSDIGFKVTPSNDEPLAYLEGYLSDQIFKRLKKAFDKKK